MKFTADKQTKSSMYKKLFDRNKKALDLKEMNTIHICFAKTDFKCPYCQKEYDDLDDKYVNRCNRNKYGWTKIKCSCGKWFGMAYNIKEEAVGFEI